MEFAIQKSDLVRELQTVTGVVEKRATLPILANLLLQTTEDGLRVGASDLEVTIRGTTPATVKKAGAVTLPAAKLHEIARSLPDAEVSFKLLDRNQVAIACKRTRYRISGQPEEDFPKFPEIDAEAVAIRGALLREMIERVQFAITTEDPRYSLNGALFALKDGTLTLVATDGHRLAYISQPVGVTQDLQFIVPKKALSEVYKLTADLEDGADVMFGVADKQVFFDVGGHRLTSTMLDGSFPRYENVMPKDCDTSLTLATDDLAQAVRRVSLLANDRFGRAVRLDLSSGKLEVSSTTEMGDANETLNVEYDGGEVSIGFNARYLLDYLAAVGASSVKLELNPAGGGEAEAKAGDKPGQFRPDESSEMDYRYVVMPMHL
jgi:DNA polymerase-3 subunit beta